MKILNVLIILLFAQITNASLYPVFNNDRGYWLNWLAYSTPIVVDSGVEFGLTHPTIDTIPYDFRLEGSLIFEPSNVLSGISTGPGNILDNIKVSGYGEVLVFENDVNIGSFTVVPEPATIILLGLGFIFLRKKIYEH